MPYATVDQLAEAMHVARTSRNEQLLTVSLAAAAAEIDQACDRDVSTPLPTDPPDPLTVVVNIARGVEWFKANDAAFGAIGFANIGALTVPADGFARHAAALIPLRQHYGFA